MKTFPAIISASLEHGYRARSRVKEKIYRAANRLTRCFRATWQRRRVADNTLDYARSNTRRDGLKRTSSRFRARDKGGPINKTDHQEGSHGLFNRGIWPGIVETIYVNSEWDPR